MSNTRNMNQSNNPFWDFVGSMQQNNPGAFPFAEGRGQEEGQFDPFNGAFWGPFGPMPHRGRRNGPPGHGHRGPPPPPSGHESDGPSHRGPPAGPHGHPHGPPHHHGKGPDVAPPPPPPFNEPPSRSPTPPTPPETPAEPHHHPRPRSPHHGGPRHHRGPSPHRRGQSPHHRRGGRCGGRGGFGPRGGHRHGPPRGGNPNFPFDLNSLAEAFAPGLFTTNNGSSRNENDGTFTPDIDVFDTASAYIIHASLPGAKKSDLDITFNPSRHSVLITGVVTRPGVDEQMMAALAQDERKVGAFEREVKLGEGVKVDDDAIAAKLEDGVLRVTVPKVLEEEEEYVTVKRVELE